MSLEQLREMSDVKILVLDDETEKTAEVPLEEYVACVTASEMPSDFGTGSAESAGGGGTDVRCGEKTGI